jgi:hypothetical protein
VSALAALWFWFDGSQTAAKLDKLRENHATLKAEHDAQNRLMQDLSKRSAEAESRASQAMALAETMAKKRDPLIREIRDSILSDKDSTCESGAAKVRGMLK